MVKFHFFPCSATTRISPTRLHFHFSWRAFVAFCFEGSATQFWREWMKFHSVQIWLCETTANTFKWDINFWMKSSRHHHKRTALVLGCKPQILFFRHHRHHQVHLNVLFCIFFFFLRSTSGMMAHTIISIISLGFLFTHTRGEIIFDTSSEYPTSQNTTWWKENKNLVPCMNTKLL